MCSIFDEEETQIEIHVEHDDKLNDKLEVDEGFELEQEPEEVGWLERHGKKVNKARANGKNKNKVVAHYNCNYCRKSFVGPSASSFKIHLKSSHKNKCPEFFSAEAKQPMKKDFFDIKKVK